MRTTLLGSCLLGLSFAVVGCDDGMKKDAAPASNETAAPAVSAPADPKGGAMEAAPKGGAMEAAPKAGATETPATSPAAPAEAPKVEEKKEEMPK